MDNDEKIIYAGKRIVGPVDIPPSKKEQLSLDAAVAMEKLAQELEFLGSVYGARCIRTMIGNVKRWGVSI